MSCIRRHVPDAPSEGESPIEKLVGWRTVMEGQLPYGNITTLMHARNAVGAYRDKLAPWEWFRCPQCGGRGLWVNRNGENRYCPRCSGTGILLARELTDPAEIALIRRTAPSPDWGRLYSRAELRPVPGLKVEGEL